MILRLLLVLALCPAACRSPSPSQQAALSADGSQADKLWALAPAGTLGGVVITEEAWRQSAQLRNDLASTNSLPPEFALDKQETQWLQFIADDAPEKYGIDIRKGITWFISDGDRNDGVLLFATIGDTLFKTLGLRQANGVWSNEDFACIKGTPYSACTKKQIGIKRLRQALNPKQRKSFIAAASQNFAQLGRGHIELVFTDDESPETTVTSILLGKGRVTLRATAQSPELTGSFPARNMPAETFETIRPGAQTYISLALKASFLSQMGLPSHLGKLLTGEMALLSNGSLVTLAIKATSAQSAQALTAKACQLAEGAGADDVRPTADKQGCRLTLSDSAYPSLRTVRMGPQQDMLLVELGQETKQPSKAPQATIQPQEKNAAVFAHFGDLQGLAKSMAKELAKAGAETTADDRVIAGRVLYFLSRIYSMNLSIQVPTPGRLDFDFDMTLFSQDPPQVYEKYLAAITQATKGNVSGYKRRMANIKKQHPQTLAAQVPQSDGIHTTMIIGIVSALAIPAMIRYMQPAKSSEFDMNLKTIAEGVIVYYDKDHIDATGMGYLPKHFPKAVPLTPPIVTCNKKNPADIIWSVAGPGGWDDMRFFISKPFLGHYAYKPDSDGKGFTAWVKYDVDCDGQIGRKEITGKVAADGFVTLGEVVETHSD